jgi:hypothetical protein
MYKTLFVAIVIVIYSCQQTQHQSTTLTDTERSAISDSIKAVIANVNKAAEEVYADRLITYFSKSDKLRFVDWDATVMYPYDSILAAWRRLYNGMTRLIIIPSEPFINVLTPDYATAINLSDVTGILKDSSSIGGPVAWTMVFTRESGQWKILNTQQAIKWREPSSKK